MTISPDPVGAADADRRSLPAALGDDDPAAVQAETPALIRGLVLEAGDALRLAAGDDRIHLAPARRAMEAVRG